MHGRTADALERTEEEPEHLFVVDRHRDERKLLDVSIELLVEQRQPEGRHQLTELIELGGLE